MTDKLYYRDSHLHSFDAVVTSCRFNNGQYEIELDKTAFFPEGGGQCADTGALDSVRVLDVQEINGKIIHYCDGELKVGSSVHGELDWEKRFQNMQSHSGEHIVSGIIHNRFGFENTGFHLGQDGMIVDFSGFVSPDELREVELEANKIVWENRAIRTLFPKPEELSSYTYRSKLELTENVRLVEIEGVDLCACCAPHVTLTGEIGLIRIFESQHRKDGVRIRMLAGKNALIDYISKEAQVSRASNLLSAKIDSVAESVERVIKDRDSLAYKLRGYQLDSLNAIVKENSKPADAFLRFFNDYSQEDMLFVIKGVLPYCSKFAACFTGTDDTCYRFIIASQSLKLRDKLNSLRAEFEIKGGGSDAMVQGSINGTKEKLEKALRSW